MRGRAAIFTAGADFAGGGEGPGGYVFGKMKRGAVQ